MKCPGNKLSSVLLSEKQTDFQIQDPAVGRQELLRAWRQDVIITQVNYLCRENGAVNERESPSREVMYVTVPHQPASLMMV